MGIGGTRGSGGVESPQEPTATEMNDVDRTLIMCEINEAQRDTIRVSEASGT